MLTPAEIPARYRLDAELGSGGMGVVYRAFDLELGRPVALKVLRERSPAALYDLKREFRVLGAISHPNLVTLYELELYGDLAFFTMELIDGAPLTAAPVDLPTLAERLLQLAAAVAAIHRAGKLHRDLKPANVLVDRRGRVVVLDFGLVTAREPPPDDRDPGLSGTLAYLPPEAFAGADPSEAADWYAFGCLLVEALSGRRLFAGDLTDLVHRKRRPLDLRRRLPGAPADLLALAAALLAPDPAVRPREAAIRECLERHVRSTTLIAPPEPAPAAAPFVGRAAELADLAAAAARARRAPVLALVHGPSGIGKSALVAQAAAAAGALVLTSRAHPSEHVPFSAFDGAIDDLSRHLLALRERADDLVAPALAPELLRLFPILARVPALAAAAGPLAADDITRRRAGVAALRRLLAALARARPLALVIEDAQWSDADSAALLLDLLSGPEAPALLVLITARDDPHARGPFLDHLDAERDLPCERLDLRLAPLDPEDAERLARLLFAAHGADADAPSLAEIQRVAGGSPFLLGELSRLVAPAGLAAPLGPAGDVVGARLARLQPPARRMLDVIAVAGRPLPVDLALDLVGPTSDESAALPHLERTSMIRWAGGRDRRAFEAYHDSIREAVLRDLPPAGRRDLHRRLADLLVRRAPADPERILEHLQGAGERERAAPYALAAAERAASALAFERAAELYGLALDLGCVDLPRWRLLERQGDALVHAGRSAAAAERFTAASDDPALGPADQERLRLRAAEHFLHSGRVDAGMAALRAILARVGVDLPASPRAAMMRSAPTRLALLLRGLRVRLSDPQDASPALLHRLDTVWIATTSLSMISHATSDYLGVLHLREALRLGEPSRLVRALGFEGAWEACIGGGLLTRRSRETVAEALRLADQTGKPYDRAWSHMSAGAAAWFRAEWRAALDHCDRARALFREHCPGSRWERAVTDVYRTTALTHLGRLRQLRDEVPEDIRDALERGDLFALNNHRQGAQSLVWLAADAPEVALRHADDAVAAWPDERFSSQHYYNLLSVAQAHLYRGDAAAALAALDRAWPRLRAAQFLAISYIGAELWHLRARAALARLRAPSPARDVAALRASVRAAIKVMDGRRLLPVSRPFAALLRAGLAEHGSERGAALAALADAAAGFDAAAMPLWAAAARLRRGALAGDPALADDAAALLRAEGVLRPERFCALLAGAPA